MGSPLGEGRSARYYSLTLLTRWWLITALSTMSCSNGWKATSWDWHHQRLLAIVTRSNATSPYLGSTSIDRLTVEMVERWQSQLLRGDATQRALSPSTVRQARIVLRQALDQQATQSRQALLTRICRTTGSSTLT